MKIVSYVLSLILVSSLFTGCSWWEPEVQIKTVYIQKECPKPKIKPEFNSYSVVILEIDGDTYYAFPKSEAIKIATNWISYREWAEANYDLIKASTPKTSSKPSAIKNK